VDFVDFDNSSLPKIGFCGFHGFRLLAGPDANCLGLGRPTVFRRNIFFEMTVVAQSSVTQKIIRPNVFHPTGFSPNRLHPETYLGPLTLSTEIHFKLLYELVCLKRVLPF